MNFMNAIKSQPVVEEATRVSGLPPMLVTAADASAVKAKQPSARIEVFFRSKSSWADSDSDDEYTECDRQRLADEHKSWMESRSQTKMQTNMIDAAVDAAVAESVDSW
jgi:hypothetical protein